MHGHQVEGARTRIPSATNRLSSLQLDMLHLLHHTLESAKLRTLTLLGMSQSQPAAVLCWPCAPGRRGSQAKHSAALLEQVWWMAWEVAAGGLVVALPAATTSAVEKLWTLPEAGSRCAWL